MGSDVCATGQPDVNKAEECLAWHYKRVNTRQEDAQKLGVPLIISEFGACLDGPSCVQEIT